LVHCFQIGSPVNGGVLQNGATLNSCNLKTKLQIEKLNKYVWLRLFLTITARFCILQPCSCWEQCAIFLFQNWTKLTTKVTLSRFSQPAFNRCQPNFYLKYMHVIQECVNFVNFGLLSTKWEFFKLGRRLHRPYGKWRLYTCAFSLRCCYLKHLYLTWRPSHGTFLPHLLVVTISESIMTLSNSACNFKFYTIFKNSI